MGKEFFDKLHTENGRRGTTLIEMVVSFALLGIFVAMSTVIISNVTGLYYRVRGENYARQVGDIVINKVSSEISGSIYEKRNYSLNPKIDLDEEFTLVENGVVNTVETSGNSIVLYDRTDTGVRMYASDGILQIYYIPIEDEITPENNRTGVIWKFDPQIYNGYKITRMVFAPANQTENQAYAAAFEMEEPEISDYDANVIAVYMSLESGKYGRFNICRYVRLYNASESAAWKKDSAENLYYIAE